ncbi:hypothetical protein EV126DRAFT_120286 [Verticillium dahliae]|nr:hypothetical protein EV126DRAFT_120286 [Verticillium dahliae]
MRQDTHRRQTHTPTWYLREVPAHLEQYTRTHTHTAPGEFDWRLTLLRRRPFLFPFFFFSLPCVLLNSSSPHLIKNIDQRHQEPLPSSSDRPRPFHQQDDPTLTPFRLSRRKDPSSLTRTRTPTRTPLATSTSHLCSLHSLPFIPAGLLGYNLLAWGCLLDKTSPLPLSLPPIPQRCFRHPPLCPSHYCGHSSQVRSPTPIPHSLRCPSCRINIPDPHLRNQLYLLSHTKSS